VLRRRAGAAAEEEGLGAGGRGWRVGEGRRVEEMHRVGEMRVDEGGRRRGRARRRREMAMRACRGGGHIREGQRVGEETLVRDGRDEERRR
jgi:hypothetical protein